MAGWQAEWGIECTVGLCPLGLLIPQPSLFFPAAAPGPLEKGDIQEDGAIDSTD